MAEPMDPQPITSTSNPLLKRVRKLKLRKHRQNEGAFFVEGIQSVWQAVRNGADVEVILVAPELLRSERALQMVAGQERAGRRVVTLSGEAFSSIAQRENPSGVGAIVRARAATLDALQVVPGSLFLALHEAGKPGNVGSIIRTADATGAAGVILTGDSTDPYDPNAVKASMGTLFTVPTCSVGSFDEVLAWARRHGIGVVTTSAQADTLYWKVAYPSPALVVFGSEGTGLPRELLGSGDLSVRIPMHGSASSLNLAVSVGVLLYEVLRQRADV